jgi:hypothetical protein
MFEAEHGVLAQRAVTHRIVRLTVDDVIQGDVCLAVDSLQTSAFIEWANLT